MTSSQHDTRVAFVPHPLFTDHVADDRGPRFAFVQWKRAFCLILVNGPTVPSSADPRVLFDVAVFLHEFVSMWRFSHTARIHPGEVRVLLRLDARSIRYEEDSGTVFLSKHLMPELGNIMMKQRRLSIISARRQNC